MQFTKKLIFDHLSPIYPKNEIEGISRLIFEKITGLSPIQLHLNQNKTISDAKLAQIMDIVNRLMSFEPIQYILGETEFYGLTFIVNPSVLIPRQETEELVDWILQDWKQLNPKILDIGTGSGCIPITLLKNLSGATSDGWDISPDALLIANENAKRNNVEVDFRCVDVLKPIGDSLSEQYDLIVSNPPYVTVSEKSLMHQNVTGFEPHLALFVPDTNPLIFYKRIAEIAIKRLKQGGILYLEINERYGNETLELLKSMDFINLRLKKDINGKERMVKGERIFKINY